MTTCAVHHYQVTTINVRVTLIGSMFKHLFFMSAKLKDLKLLGPNDYHHDTICRAQHLGYYPQVTSGLLTLRSRSHLKVK
jgi:hypothetical protein